MEWRVAWAARGASDGQEEGNGTERRPVGSQG